MRTFLMTLAAGALIATAADAQQFRRPDPDTNTTLAIRGPDSANPQPLPAEAGRQTGVTDVAAGDHDFPRPQADVGSVSPTAVLAREYPLSWEGDSAAWSSHSAACARMYKGYDPATDTFRLRRGVRAMCPASVR